MKTNPTCTADGNLSETAAAAAIEIALRKANEIGVKVSVAVLDAGGHLLAFVRMDDIHAGTVDVSIAKAKCAAMFKRSTKVFAEAYAGGATSLPALPGVLPFEGGVPIVVDGRILGAVGCSGASPAHDGEVATAAAAAVETYRLDRE